jgi:hypothetical protein
MARRGESVQAPECGADISKVKRVLRSVVYGALVQAFAIYLVWMMSSNDAGGTASAEKWIMWNVELAELLAGPMPQVGYGINGTPIFEPAPIHTIMGFVGLALGLVTYSSFVYLGLRAFGARQAPPSTSSHLPSS